MVTRVTTSHPSDAGMNDLQGTRERERAGIKKAGTHGLTDKGKKVSEQQRTLWRV